MLPSGCRLMTGAWSVHLVGMLLLPQGFHLLCASETKSSAPNALSWSLLRLPGAALLDMASIPEVWWPQVRGESATGCKHCFVDSQGTAFLAFATPFSF